MRIFTVYDEPAGAYLQPFFARTRAEAIRSFRDACLSEEHQFHRHATDYTLFQCGHFDEDSGVVAGESVPVRLVSAQEVLDKEKGA